MKTELISTSSNGSIWSTSDEIPHLAHEYLPVIGSCQASSILSNLEQPDKMLHQNVDLSQNVDLIVLQNTNFKLPEETLIDNALGTTEDYIVLKEDDKLENCKFVDTDKQNNNQYVFCKLCPFLSTNDLTMSKHIVVCHQNGNVAKMIKFKCPGCANIFYSKTSLRSHLSYDHNVDGPDLLKILHSVIFNAKTHENNDENDSEMTNDNKSFAQLKECKTEMDSMTNVKNKMMDDELPIYEISLNNNNPLPTVRVLNLTELENLKDPIIDINDSKEVLDNKSKPDADDDNADNNEINTYTYQLNSINRKNKCIVPGCKVRLNDEKKIGYHVKCHVQHGYKCPECSNTFCTWNILSGHLWRNHKIDMELFACDRCDYKTYSLSKLNSIHKLIHGDVRAYTCDVCKKSFKNSKQLNNHKVTHKQKKRRDDANNYNYCEYCKKTFNDRRQLKIHTDGVHKKLKPYLCSFCGYKGSTRSSLKSHMRQHTGEKPFACTECTFATSDHNSLRRHKLRHSGQKPYKCSHCDYACIQTSTYKVHLKTKHPGLEKELLFACAECSFRTINKDIYTAHLFAAHNKK